MGLRSARRHGTAWVAVRRHGNLGTGTGEADAGGAKMLKRAAEGAIGLPGLIVPPAGSGMGVAGSLGGSAKAR